MTRRISLSIAFGGIVSISGAIFAYRNREDTPRFPLPPDDPACPQGMALIPGGIGKVALPDESFQRSNTIDVRLTTFCLDRNEVTVGEYEHCVEAGHCSTPPRDRTQFCNYGVQGRRWHPINCVSYADAEAYCRVAGKRLPTQHEWEYAAEGGGLHFIYPWGNNEPLDQLCWNHRADRIPATCVVRSFPSESFGLFDMGGNVSEYTDGTCVGCVRDELSSSGGDTDVRNGREDLLRVHALGHHWFGYETGFRCAK